MYLPGWIHSASEPPIVTARNSQPGSASQFAIVLAVVASTKASPLGERAKPTAIPKSIAIKICAHKRVRIK